MKGESRAVVLRILSYLKPFKKAFLLAGLLLAGSTVIGFLQPLVIQTITDDGMLQKNMPVLVRAVLALAALVLLNQAGEMLQTRVFADVHNASFYALFQQAFQKLLHLKKSYFEDKNNAEILSFLQMDVSQVSSITDRYTIMSVGYVFRIISGLIGLFIISWKLALIVLAMVPGMPHLPFLLFSALLGFTGWRMSKRPQAAEAEEKSLETLTRTITETSEQQVSWETIPLIEPISLSLGYKLVALVDKAQGNPLTQRIRGVRQVISDGNGVLLPEIRIRENFRLKPSQYAIFINGIKADEADIPADKLMALPSSETYGEIDGVLGNDPAYGMPVTWIQPAQKAKALNMGYQVIDSASVIATHVNKIVRSYIPDLFNYDDITQLHNRLASMAPRLAEDLSAALNYSQLLKVYRALLTEGVSLRDIVTIATVLVASSAVTKDHILLAADVRLALRRSITHPFVRKQELTVYTLNNELENLLTNVVNQAQQGGKVMLDSVPVDPNMLNQFQSTMPQVKEQMKAAGKDPVLLVPPQLRPLLARYARLFAPGLHVLSYNEVPDELELKIMGALM